MAALLAAATVELPPAATVAQAAQVQLVDQT
jgi:hypothetical protein